MLIAQNDVFYERRLGDGRYQFADLKCTKIKTPVSRVQPCVRLPGGRYQTVPKSLLILDHNRLMVLPVDLLKELIGVSDLSLSLSLSITPSPSSSTAFRPPFLLSLRVIWLPPPPQLPLARSFLTLTSNLCLSSARMTHPPMYRPFFSKWTALSLIKLRFLAASLEQCARAASLASSAESVQLCG